MLWRRVEQASENCFEYMWQMGEAGCAEVVGVVCSSMQWRGLGLIIAQTTGRFCHALQ
jgi:hypothetical protein